MEDIIKSLHDRISRLERANARGSAAPTIPTYNSTNFPQDAVHGQIAKDQNEDLWIFGNDDAWRQIGKDSNLPVCYAQSGLHSASGLFTYYPTWDVLFETNDSTVFELDSTDHTKIDINVAGMYIAILGFTMNPNPTNCTVGFASRVRADDINSVLVEFVPNDTIDIEDVPVNIGSQSGTAVGRLPVISNGLPWKTRTEFTFNSSAHTYSFQATLQIVRLSTIITV